MKHLNQEALREKKKQTAARVIKTMLADVLLVGLILLTFAFFHHVLPMLETRRDKVKTTDAELAQSTAAPVSEPEPLASPPPPRRTAERNGR